MEGNLTNFSGSDRGLADYRRSAIGTRISVILGPQMTDAHYFLSRFEADTAVEHVGSFFWRVMASTGKLFATGEWLLLLRHLDLEMDQSELAAYANKHLLLDDDWNNEFLRYRDEVLPKALALSELEFEATREFLCLLASLDLAPEESIHLLAVKVPALGESDGAAPH